MSILKVTDESTRAEIEAAIAALKAKHDRMPEHWADRRAAVMADIEALVDQWLVARA